MLNQVWKPRRRYQYAFGADQKVRLLEYEGVSPAELARTLRGDADDRCSLLRYLSECPEDPPRKPPPFRSVDEAIEAGYRPCHLCCPVTVRETT